MSLFNSLAAVVLAAILTDSAVAVDAGFLLKTRGEPVEISFTSRVDQSLEKFVFILPKSYRPDRSYDLLIALHGHGSDRWQFVRDKRSECQATRDFAAAHDLILVSPDYRAKTSWMGPLAEADLRQVIDDLHRQFRIGRIILAGGSMGGTSSLAFAAINPECIDGVVSMNGTANMLEYNGFEREIAEAYGGSKLECPEVYRQRSAELFSDRLKLPIAVTTGGQDQVVPPESVVRLVHALQAQKSPVLSIHRDEGGHNTGYEDALAAYEFVYQQLQSIRPGSTVPVADQAPSPLRIVCLGDSVTGVYYHSGGQQAYPEMLQHALSLAQPRRQFVVINAGVSGNTTADGLRRLDSDVLAHKPTIVTISFGLNDMTRLGLDDFRVNLELLVERCHQAGCRVVLCTPNAVLNSRARPVDRLVEYCLTIRNVAHEKGVSICDQYAAGERFRQRAPLSWRLTMSDEIHPNMHGHKRMAEELCGVICGQTVSLDSVGPPKGFVTRFSQKIAAGQRMKVVVMKPVESLFRDALVHEFPKADVELVTWETAGKSLAQIEQDARALVRAAMPDLVVLTFDREYADVFSEADIHAISWIMNSSLSFGRREWECVVVHPSALILQGEDQPPGLPESDLIQHLVRGQHLPLIERISGETASGSQLLGKWLKALK